MLDQNPHHLIADLSSILPLIVNNALSAVGALVVLLVGLWLSGRADRLTRRMLERAAHVDPMLLSFFGSLARYLVLTLTGLAVLSEFGIQTASLVTVLGAASLAVGLALQGTLSNLAAGIMLLIFRPFRIGHKVQVAAGIGTVRELTLFWTEIVTDDQVQIIVPNASVWGQPVRNFSVYPPLPPTGEVRFPLPDGTALVAAVEKVQSVVAAQPQVLGEPPPSVLLDRGPPEHGLEIVVSFATAEGATAAVKSELIEAVSAALDAAHGSGAARTD
jgi:small conductance mechanosensitive channel